MHIVFILQCHVCKKTIVEFTHQRKNTGNVGNVIKLCGHFTVILLTVLSYVPRCKAILPLKGI
jgi:hypothetical protein